MAQHDLDVANASGSSVRADLNLALAALGSTMKGSSAPSAPLAGMMWLEDDNPSSTVWTLRIYDGTDWIALGTVDTTGNSFSPASATSGLKNFLDNGNFQVNQRAYASGTATAGANQYTLDRWRVVTSGQAVSWSDSAGVRTVTAPAGGMEQVIEGSAIAADTYTLSWTGTAAATVNGGAISSGGTVSLSGGSDVTVRFSNGTVALPQLERGRIATTVERRHPALDRMLCQRTLFVTERSMVVSSAMLNGIGHTIQQTIHFPVRMRTTPTVVGAAYSSGVGNASQTINGLAPDGCQVQVTANGSGNGFVQIVLNAGCIFTAEQ
jgi:hypothetical protein